MYRKINDSGHSLWVNDCPILWWTIVINLALWQRRATGLATRLYLKRNVLDGAICWYSYEVDAYPIDLDYFSFDKEILLSLGVNCY